MLAALLTTLIAHIEIRPDSALIDEPVAIVVNGVPPASKVTVSLRGYGDAPQWSSSATFVADANGVVDLTRMAPVSGDYAGVDPMGLFWSAGRDAPADAPRERRVHASVPAAEIWNISASVDGQVVATGNVARRAVASDVAITAVHDRGLVGVFYQPGGGGRHPAIIALSGSGGGLMPPASFPGGLASRGYAVLALAYFGVEDLPPSLHNIPLEHFGTALQWLAAQPAVDPQRIGVLGASRGAELALLLGSLFPQICTVVAYMPSNMVVSGCCSGRSEASWTIGGHPLPWAVPGRSNFLTQQRAAIHVENIHGAVLLISGRADRVWPSTEMANAVMARLDRSHFSYAHQHFVYADAGHAIARPYTSTMDIDHAVHPLTGRTLSLGGTPAGTAKAREDSWRHLLAFLDEHLRQ